MSKFFSVVVLGLLISGCNSCGANAPQVVDAGVVTPPSAAVTAPPSASVVDAGLVSEAQVDGAGGVVAVITPEAPIVGSK